MRHSGSKNGVRAPPGRSEKWLLPIQPATRKHQPQESHYLAGDRDRRVFRDPSFPVVFESGRFQRRHSAALSAFVFCRSYHPDFSAVRGPDFCPGPQPSEAFCGAAAGRSGLEVPHPPGGGRTAALLPAGHHDVLVCLRADESFDRTVVFASGRRGAGGHGGRGLAGDEVRGAERSRRGRIHCGVAGNATGLCRS